MTLAMVAMWVFIGLLVGLVAGLVLKAGGYGRRTSSSLSSGVSWGAGSPGCWRSLPTRAWSR
jgi:hypothetical protein